jgi:hypothetical protein
VGTGFPKKIMRKEKGSSNDPEMPGIKEITV